MTTSTSTSTSILIRVQARGGKFLGPDIGYSFITVRDVASGVVLAQSSASGDSGQLGPTLAPGVSTGVVMTAPLTPNWLSATPGSPSPTAGFLASFDLAAPTLIEISAAGTPNGTANQHRTSATMWIWPGAQLTTEPGLVLELPGLNVQILEPNPATPPPPNSTTITVNAWVTMMCGCKIVDGGAWPTSEFQVNAWLVGPNGMASLASALTIKKDANGSEIPSVFTGTLIYPETSGEYQLIVAAIQPATSNGGGSALVLTL